MMPILAAGFQFSDWWLPPVYSEHGHSIDALFKAIFWITMVAFVLVQITLVVFLIKYRYRPAKAKAHYIHGNTRLEMIWTLTPAVILALLAVGSKIVWSNYRYPQVPTQDKAQVLVVGEQFKWNVVYPGPDGVIGKYLDYPRPSDPQYRRYPRKDAIRRINDYIADENPLGKDMSDAAGQDDDWESPQRPLIVPIDKTIEVILGSKDVLHDFFLPNFRVKLDAVPGMMGYIHFKPQKQSTTARPIDQVALNDRLWIDRDTPGATPAADGAIALADPANPDARLSRFGSLGMLVRQRLSAKNVTDPTPQQMQEEGLALREQLKKAGVTELKTITPFEIVCEELCGMGHGTMRGEMFVVSAQEYRNFIHKDAPPAPATQPQVAQAAQAR